VKNAIKQLVDWLRRYNRELSADDLIAAFNLLKSHITQEQFNKFYQDFLFYRCAAIVTDSCMYGRPSVEEQRASDRTRSC
jgi:hypothetical protein